jgi:hypothetical protein
MCKELFVISQFNLWMNWTKGERENMYREANYDLVGGIRREISTRMVPDPIPVEGRGDEVGGVADGSNDDALL